MLEQISNISEGVLTEYYLSCELSEEAKQKGGIINETLVASNDPNTFGDRHGYVIYEAGSSAGVVGPNYDLPWSIYIIKNTDIAFINENISKLSYFKRLTKQEKQYFEEIKSEYLETKKKKKELLKMGFYTE